MATYDFASLLNTTDGMNRIAENISLSKEVEVAGVDWFTYAGNTVNTVYVSPYNSIGFGKKERQLKLCFIYRTILYDIYRQEGTLVSGKRFLKIRIYGHFSQTSGSSFYFYFLEYEMFLIEGQIIFINVIRFPTKDRGTSSITDGTNTANLNITDNTKAPFYIYVKNAGISQKISYEKYSDATVTGLSVTTLPNKTTYYQKELFDSAGMVVSVSASNGMSTPISDYELSGFNSNSVGTKTITVTAFDKTASFKVNVLDATITGISVTSLPDKVTYKIGEDIDLTGMVVSYRYPDGSLSSVTEGYTVSTLNSATAGIKSITVELNGYTDSFNVTVVEPTGLTTYTEQIGLENASDVVATLYEEINTIVITGKGKAKNLISDQSLFKTLDNSDNKFLPRKIRRVVIGEGVTQIGNYTFYHYEKLQNFAIPDSVSRFSGLGYSGIKSIHQTAKCQYTDIDSSDVERVIHDDDSILIPIISCNKLKTLKLPNNITSISKLNAPQIEKIEFPLTITQASITCPKIKEAWLPNITGIIKSSAFNGCNSLESFYIPNGVTTISDAAFQYCSKIEELVIPKSVTKIDGYSPLRKMESLKRVYILNPDTYIYGNQYAISNQETSDPHPYITIYSFAGSSVETWAKKYSYNFIALGDFVSLSLDAEPLKTKYQIGELLDIKGFKLNASYSSGEKVSVPPDTIEGFDSDTVGEKLVTLTYEGSSASFKINVENTPQKILEYIQIVKFPEKKDFLVNDSFESKGLIVNAVYDDGSEEFIDYYSIEIPSTATPGEKTVTISYKDKKTGYKIKVNGIASIEVYGRYGSNGNFFIGDTNTGDFRYAVSSIKVIYENGSQALVPASEFKETEVDTSKAGDFYTTLSYAGFEIHCPYTVYGDSFTTTTGYPDTNSATLTFDANTGLCIISGTGQLGSPKNVPSSFGKKVKTLQINEGMTGIYTFNYCSEVSIITIPSSVEELYASGYSYGLNGILGSGDYSKATLKINAKKNSISGAPWGHTKTTIVWTAKPEKLNIVSLPTQTKYMTGDTFSLDGLKCNILYSNGKTYAPDGEVSCSPVDMTTPGKQSVTLSCVEDGITLTATFDIKIVAKMTGIRISSYPSKIYYKIGESLDLSGLEVVTVDGEGNESALTDYTVSGFDSSKAGAKTITVSYQTEIDGIETFIGYDEFEIKVTKDGKNPFEDNTDPINVKVHWINGEFEDLTNDNIQSNTLSLQESLCNKAYFIFGGCISNQITFKCYHQQFIGTDEATYPSGKIEVYLECKGTEIKIFTGEIATGERDANSFVRTIVAYDYLYKLRNTDIAWWYKNNTKDKQMVFTQKQFRDALFKYLGIEQVDVKLKYDNAYVPNTANSSEMNVANILEDLCLQNNVFGWMNRDGKFEYKKLKKNCKHRGTTVSGVETFDFYESEVHLDRFKSFKATEGRVWYFNYVYTDPDPSGEVFTSGEPTAQDAYERNVFYNRNSFFVGNQDWLNYAYDANEYGDYTRTKPKYAICYGTVAEDIIKKQYYRAQGYSVEVQGNPFNMVGQTVEMTHSKPSEDGSAIQWVIHSYIMSRTLKLGITGLIDTYIANNSPYNGNNQQLGKNTPEITSTINRTRSEMPTISYAEFTDGSDSEFSPAMIDDFSDGSGGSGGTSEQLKKAQLRCLKRIKKADYDALVKSGNDRKDTLYFTYEEE